MKKVFFITLIVLVLLATAGVVFVRFYLAPLTASVLKESVAKQSNNFYQLDFKSLKINLLNRNIKIENLSLKPDTSRLAVYPKKVFLDVEVPRIEIKGIALKQLLRQKLFDARRLKLFSPQIKLFSHTPDTTGLPPEKPQKPSNWNFFVKKITSQQTNLFFTQNSGQTIEIRQIDLQIDDFHALSLKPDSIDFQKFQFDIAQIKIPLADSLDRIEIDSLRFESQSKSFTIQNFRLLPLYSAQEYHQHAHWQKNRSELSLKEIQIKNFQFNKFLKNKQIEAQTMSVAHATLSLYKNKDLRLPAKRKKLIQGYFRAIPLPFGIDSLNIKSGKISYRQKEQNRTASLFLSHLSLKASNLSNDSTRNTQAPLSANFSAKFMGKSPLSCQLNVEMNSPQMRHSLSGELRAMPLGGLNMFLIKNGLKVREGYSKSLRFRLRASQKNVSGTVVFLYNDLKVELLHKKKKKRRRLTSFLANTAIHNNNPKRNKPPYQAACFAPYDSRKSFVGFWIDGILSGVKTTILPGRKRK